jgi:hypothetical protein
MSLIILKQTPTGTYTQLPWIPENEIHETWYFDTSDGSVFDVGVVGGSQFEMALNQIVHTDILTGDQWTYNGPDVLPPSVTYIPGSITPPGPSTYTLTLQTNPRGSTLPILLSDISGPHEEGAIVNISILNEGETWLFLNWTLNGEVISGVANFVFTTLASNTILTANFEQESPEPEPEPEPEPKPIDFVHESFYPLELRIKGIQIPIKSITSKENTGIFTDEMVGDYSYPITIAISEAVMVALNLPNDPQSAWNFSQSIPAELWKHGNRAYRGHLDIIDGNEKMIKGTFEFDSGFFINQNKTRSIRDCYEDTDIITFDEPLFAVGGYEIRFNFRDLRLTVNGTDRLFLKQSYEDHISMLEAMADYLEGLPLFLNVSIQYSEDLTDESSRIITWDTSIVSNITLTPTVGTSRYSRARRLTNERLIMDAWDEVDQSKRIAFPTIYNRELYEGNNQLHDGIVNRYDTEGRLYFGNIVYFAFSESFRWENVLIPFLYLTDVVKTVFAKLNIQVSGSFFEDDRVKRMLLYNNRTLDFVRVTLNGAPARRTSIAVHAGDSDPEQESYRYQNVHDFNIKLKNHVPDYTITEFLKSMKNYFFLKYDFNILQNRVEIRFIRDVIRDMEVLDFTKKAGRVYTLSHGKEQGIQITYERKDPLLEDGQSATPPDPDYTVTNYLALDVLDAEILEVAFVRSLRAYFQLTTDQDNPPFWKLIAFEQRDEAIPPSGGQGGSGGHGDKRPWNVGMVPLVDGFFSGRKMPAIEMTANNPEVNLTNEDTGLRIFAFYGRQSDGANQPYSFASCTRYNARELASQNQYDLDLRSEDSYPFWKDLESIIDRGKEYETTILLEDSDLIKLSKTSRIRIANIDYLIDEREILLTESEYSIAKFTMWKINLKKKSEE